MHSNAVTKEMFVLTLFNGPDENVIPLSCIKVNPQDHLLEGDRCNLTTATHRYHLTVAAGSNLHLQHLQQEERVQGVQVGLRRQQVDSDKGGVRSIQNNVSIQLYQLNWNYQFG